MHCALWSRYVQFEYMYMYNIVVIWLTHFDQWSCPFLSFGWAHLYFWGVSGQCFNLCCICLKIPVSKQSRSCSDTAFSNFWTGSALFEHNTKIGFLSKKGKPSLHCLYPIEHLQDSLCIHQRHMSLDRFSGNNAQRDKFAILIPLSYDSSLLWAL